MYHSVKCGIKDTVILADRLMYTGFNTQHVGVFKVRE